MAGKKKKHNHINRKQLKQKKAESKNNFFKRIRQICYTVNGKDVYELIPREELESIYKIRCLPYKIIIADGNTVFSKTLKSIKSTFKFLMDNFAVDITNNGDKLSLSEWHTIGIVFFKYLEDLQEDKYRDAAKIKAMQSRFRPFQIMGDEAFRSLETNMDIACLENNDLYSHVFWMKHSYETNDKRYDGIINLITLYHHAVEKIYDDKDNASRTAAWMSWGLSKRGLIHLFIERDRLGLDCEYDKTPINVYIQAHALQRIKERLDCLRPIWQQLNLIYSIRESKVLEEKGIYFIEFMLNEIKVGYLVADLKEDKLIIRTFLFLTQNGTPEGNKLVELYGLGKLDKSFLAMDKLSTFLTMDKLSTFLTTDMCSDSNLSEIFQQAGCQYLLDIYDNKKIKDMCYDHIKEFNVNEIIKYLGLNDKHSYLYKDIMMQKHYAY